MAVTDEELRKTTKSYQPKKTKKPRKKPPTEYDYGDRHERDEGYELGDDAPEGKEGYGHAPVYVPPYPTQPYDGKKHGSHNGHGKCAFEVDFPYEPPLTGYVEAAIYEDGKHTNNVIRADKDWEVKCHWHLSGALKDCIGGYWCLTLYMESIGPSPEYKIAYGDLIPLDPCGDCHYYYDIKVPAGKIDPEYCSDPYKLVVAVTYLTPCKTPGPMAGFCELQTVLFYESEKANT